MNVFTGLLSFSFLLVGFIVVIGHLYFKMKGRRIPGEVIGIEKYIATTKTSNTTSKSLMYRPIVKYLFNGAPYIFVGGGRNVINYAVGQTINLLNIPSSPKLTKIDTNLSLIFGICICLFSLVPGHHFITSSMSFNIKLISIATYCIIAYFGYRKVQSYDKSVNLFLQLLSISKFETKETLKGRDIFTSKEDIKTEEKRHYKAGLAITMVFFLAVLALFVQCYSSLSVSSLTFLSSLFSESYSQNELVQIFKRDPKLIGASFSLVMMLLCTYSMIMQIKKR